VGEDGVTTARLLAEAWEVEPSIVIGCALLLAVWAAAGGLRFHRKAVWFVTGVAVLLLDLVGPLDVLGDDYLFSAHMLEHLVLVLVVAPLLLLGIPEPMARRIVAWRPAAAVERVLRRPVVAWSVAVGTLWLWHAPPLYNATLASEQVHILEHLSFLVTWTIFWWPVLTPLPESRLDPMAALLYLYAAMVANSVLGILLTFAPLGLYPAYVSPGDELGALGLIRGTWGLTPGPDQQLGGLLMWVLGMLAFLWAAMAMIARWYRMPEKEVVDA
jgi:putative membrane protein